MVVTTAKRPKPRTHMTQEDLAHESALALVEEQFRDLDVVWAKIPQSPWWPAVVFHSWDAVRDVGLPTEEKKLPILEPRREPVLDADGSATGTFRVVRYCLVMFVDQFNFAVVETSPKFIVSYVPYYTKHRDAVINAKPGSKFAKHKKQFNDALTKADGLLHMGMDHTPEDLMLLEKPKNEKSVKKRRTDSQLPPPSPQGDESFDDAWDDQETDEDDGGAFEQPSAARNRRSKKTSDSESSETSSKRRPSASVKSTKKKNGRAGGVLKGKGIVKRPFPASKRRPGKQTPRYVDDSDEFEAPKSLKNQRKKIPKAATNEPIDLTSTPESATKQRKGSGTSKAKRIKQPAIDGSSEDPSSSSARGKKSRGKKKSDADMTELAHDDDDGVEKQSDSTQPVVMTPLSAIWTTKAASDQSSSATSGLAYKQDFVWDASLFTDNDVPVEALIASDATSETSKPASGEATSNGRERALGKRQPRSVQQAQIRQNLMLGNLDPHTMVQCESYRQAGEEENSRSRGPGNLPPPFTVVVHPDATFVCDLHAHLATCEIIGFLGGKWDDVTKTLYIQAAFPCRSLMIDGDDGSTDVEMDPGSEIELRGIIHDAELEVVGWYHSHPAFAPDPSIRDIENQTSYQQLFKRTQTSNGEANVTEPFVGLIVGTYDTRRDSPVSLFRYFHVRGEKVSGGARREIFMPYEFIPARRLYRSVLTDEANEKIRGLPVYPSVLKALGMPQRFRSADALASVVRAVEEGSVEVTSATKVSPSRRKPALTARKRKQSADLGVSEVPVKRGKRGRKKRSSSVADESSQIDLTLDDVEEVTPAEDASAATAIEVIDVTANDPEEGGEGDAEIHDGGDESKPSSGAVDQSEPTKRGDATEAADCVGDAVVVQAASSKQDASTPTDATDVAMKDELGADPIDLSVVQEKQQSADPSSQVGGDDPVAKVVVASAAVSTADGATERSDPTEASASASSASQDSSESSPADAANDVGLENAQSSGEKRKPAPTVVIDASMEVPSGVSPSSVASNGSGGRRRNRKPAHTSKSPWRSDRSPKPDATKNATDNPQAVATGYFPVFQSMDSSFARSGPLNDATSTTEEDTDKAKGEPKEDTREPKDPEYFFIGDADMTPSKEEEKAIVASTAAAVVVDLGLAGNCSTDDEIELVAVDEGDKPSETDLAIAVAEAGKTEGAVEAVKSVTDTLQKSNAVLSTLPVDPPTAVDEIGLVHACLDALVDAVVGDAGMSNQPVVKVESSRAFVPAGETSAAPVREMAPAGDSKEVCATPELVIVKTESKVAASGDPATSDALAGTCAVDSKIADALSSSTAEPGRASDEAAADKCPSSTCTTDPATDVKMECVAQERVGTESGAGVQKQQQPTRDDAAPSALSSDDKALAVVKPEPEATAQTTVSSCDNDRGALKSVKAEPEQTVVEAVPVDKKPLLLFGRDRQHEDIRTSLERMGEIMKRERPAGELATTAPRAVSSSQEGQEDAADAATDTKPIKSEVDVTSAIDDAENRRAATAERLEAHLASLRTRYGRGMVGCVEQVVTLVDYYRDFERRIDLAEHWKAKMNKLRKIEASLSEYVRYLNLSVAQRRAFVEDLVGYLELSWELTRDRA